MSEEADDVLRIGVHTTVGDSGDYVIRMSVGDDICRIMTTSEAQRHAQAVATAAEYAMYDAAILAQHEHFGLKIRMTCHLISYIHEHRAPINDEDTIPLRLEPIVSFVHYGEPWLKTFVNEVEQGMWSAADAMGHAMFLLGSIPVTSLDTLYKQYMVTEAHSDDETAHRAVNNLHKHRMRLGILPLPHKP